MAYFGFTFPYTVIDFSGEATDAYTLTDLVEREDAGTHPFYEKWKIKVPKGI